MRVSVSRVCESVRESVLCLVTDDPISQRVDAAQVNRLGPVP